VIRKASPHDLGWIAVLEEKCFPKYPYPRWFLAMLRSISPGLFLVYEADGRIIGYASTIIRRRIICHLMSLCVEPSMRRRGVGRALLDETERRSREAGCSTLRLEVSYVNMPALRLYSSLGYRPAYFKPGYYPGGEPALVMYKALLLGRDKL